MIPYGRHQIDPSDVDAVVDVLKSDWLTTGPKIGEFEEAVARYTQTSHAVAVSSGTAALHCAAYAIGIQPGDEVIVPAITFAATANCVIAQGGRPVIVDVDPQTLLIDTNAVATHITPRTKAIIAVDYAGQPCNYPILRDLADRHQIALISDACHALGARCGERSIGQWADLAVYSFHPVKHITTGEGGAVVSDDSTFVRRMRRFRNHGIDADLHQRIRSGTWQYEVIDLGFNYRITDFQCALGISQLKKIEQWIGRRRAIAEKYDRAFGSSRRIRPLKTHDARRHVYHLYVVRFEGRAGVQDRERLFEALRDLGIGVNVHYLPLNLHPYYQQKAGAFKGQCPVAEAVHEKILSLPIFPAMGDKDVDFIIQTLLDLTA